MSGRYGNQQVVVSVEDLEALLGLAEGSAWAEDQELLDRIQALLESAI